jgi:hypothetical protein
MDTVTERAFVKAMVKVMSLQDELKDLRMYDDGHQDIIRGSIERDLEAWELILNLINESKSNSK